MSINANAQENSLKPETEKISDTLVVHSPKKAALLSAVLPGLGQYYNKKYWKIPVVWGAIAGSIYAISYNQKQYVYVRDIYQLYMAKDQATIDLYGDGRAEYIKNVKDSYKRNRDLMFLVTIGLHILNIIDANVDAHFYTFDVSPDLSIKAEPFFNKINFANSTAFGLKVSLNF